MQFLFYLNIYILFTDIYLLNLTLLRAGTGRYCYFGEGHLLGTLHPPSPGPKLFYVGEEEEPGWSQYPTDPPRGD